MDDFTARPFIDVTDTDFAVASDALRSGSNLNELARQFAEYRQYARYELAAEICEWLRDGGDKVDESYARLIETRWGSVLPPEKTATM